MAFDDYTLAEKLSSVSTDLSAIIARANAKTGKSDTTVNNAVNSLISGFGSSSFVIGTFTLSSSASSHVVTFPTALSKTPDYILFFEGDNTSNRSTSRTKYAFGGVGHLWSSSSSAYVYQVCSYGSTSNSHNVITNTTYGPITYNNTSTTSSSYGCIRKASATGFTAYQKYASSTAYPLIGTYAYIAFSIS